MNQVQSSMLDPSKSQLGSGGGGGSMFNPDQFNTMKFNFFNPQSQSGGGGGGGNGGGGSGGSGGGGGGGSGGSGGSQLPKFDANKVNQLQSNMLDPSSSKLGTSGGAGGGFDPDQFNSKQFNFFNPQNQLGKRG